MEMPMDQVREILGAAVRKVFPRSGTIAELDDLVDHVHEIVEIECSKIRDRDKEAKTSEAGGLVTAFNQD